MIEIKSPTFSNSIFNTCKAFDIFVGRSICHKFKRDIFRFILNTGNSIISEFVEILALVLQDGDSSKLYKYLLLCVYTQFDERFCIQVISIIMLQCHILIHMLSHIVISHLWTWFKKYHVSGRHIGTESNIKDTIKTYFAIVIRCYRLRLWVDYYIYFKITPVFF